LLEIDNFVALGKLMPWTGMAWRAHKRHRNPLDAGGSLRASGRWHVAPDDAAGGDAWPALYAALNLATCTFEVQRIITRQGGSVSMLRDYRYSEVRAALRRTLDVHALLGPNLSAEMLIDDLDFSLPRMIASIARANGAEAILVPSASGIGANIVIFPDRLDARSRLDVVRSIDPNLGSQAI
jgi:RES domain-containing protein